MDDAIRQSDDRAAPSPAATSTRAPERPTATVSGWRPRGAGRLLPPAASTRLAAGLRLRSAWRAALLHVDAAAEVRAFGNRHARRDDVAVDRPVVADVDLLGRGDVAGHFAEDDDGLGKHLRLDLAVRPDRQHVLTQLDLAFDLAFDRQVFAAVQLAFDDDRFADVHNMSSPVHAECRRHRRARRRSAVGGAWPLAAPGLAPWAGRCTSASPLHPVSTCGTLHLSEVGLAGCPRLYAGAGSGQYTERVTRCLVLLLLRVSGECYDGRSRMRIYFDHNATTPVDPAVAETLSRASCARTSETPRACIISGSRRRPAGRRPARGRRADWRPIRRRSCSRAAAPRRTTSRCGASPRLWSRRAGGI